MGEIYAAKNIATGKSVALKLIGAKAPRTADRTRRFLTEARAATAIRHANVIEVFDLFEDDDGTLFMVMELLEGEDLAKLRARAGALTLHEIARIAVPVAKALKAAHGKGIIHRDLKPQNIFLAVQTDGSMIPKVLDFGIAKILDPAKIGAESAGHSTSNGLPLGTPHYMSFEQAMSEKVDHRADIWALGVIVFEGLCGRRPLEFESIGEMYKAFWKRPVPRIRELVPALPLGVANVIDRCLKKRRDDRLDSLDTFIEAFAPYLDPHAPDGDVGGVIAVRSVAPRPAVWIFPTAGVVALGAVAAAVLLTRASVPPPPRPIVEERSAEPSTTTIGLAPNPVPDPPAGQDQTRANTVLPTLAPPASSSAVSGRRPESTSTAPVNTSPRGRGPSPSASATAAKEPQIFEKPPY
jgi:serine/threonine-protein kinase